MNPLYRLYQELLNLHGPQGWWPITSMAGKPGFDDRGYHNGDYSFPKTPQQRFEVILGAILTQNTAWKNVEKALLNLKNTVLLSREKIENLPEKKLAQLIRPAGYFNQKAKKIKLFLKARPGPDREELLSVWGIGPETADSILLYAFHKPIFVVDAYTKRVLLSRGLCKKDASYDELQDLFNKSLPKDHRLFNEYHALLVEHAKSGKIIKTGNR
ncbi:MAG: endonuclease III domain-containing protein [Nanoarchaeota archaeon]|nr:endonuclease III domain-containing protein [Nanoarchaeota archaeon]